MTKNAGTRVKRTIIVDIIPAALLQYRPRRDFYPNGRETLRGFRAKWHAQNKTSGPESCIVDVALVCLEVSSSYSSPYSNGNVSSYSSSYSSSSSSSSSSSYYSYSSSSYYNPAVAAITVTAEATIATAAAATTTTTTTAATECFFAKTTKGCDMDTLFDEEAASPPGKHCARPLNQKGYSPRAVSNRRKGSRFPARPLKQPRGLEPGTSSFRGGRFAHCATWAP